jgi:hypothetical protein
MLVGEIYYRAIGRPWGPATYWSTDSEKVAIGQPVLPSDRPKILNETTNAGLVLPTLFGTSP